MSRAYRIRVSETLRRVLRASDHVSTQLELLEILPAEEMSALLTEHLQQQGFEESNDGLTRRSGNITIRVDPGSGTVTVQSDAAKDVDLETGKSGLVYEETDDSGRKQVQKRLRQQARQELEGEAEKEEQRLQKEVTDQLEAELMDVQAELNQVVNRVTAEALKQKASRIGQIKELTEDPQSGSMTIVLEV